MRRAILLWTVALSTAPGASVAPGAGDELSAPVSPQALALLARAQEHYTAARFGEALAAAEAGLEYEPELRELLDLASRAAGDANEHDAAIWYALTLRDLLGDSKADREQGRLLGTRIGELDLVAAQAGEVVRKYEDFAGSVLALARSCVSRKLHVNAVDLFLSCKGTRHEAKADAELDKLYEKEEVASSLLTNGMDLPPRQLSREKARRIAFMDSKHSTWPTAYSKETRNYDVRTDIGYEMLNDICTAMDEMNRFYRKVFEPRGNPKKCKLEAFRNRKEFDEYNQGTPRSVLAFFVPSETRIVAYDGREQGRPLSDFWSTLFHEASHQFTHEVSKGLVPGWLNEGTASYFEGARLLPNGSVETNLVPRNRLRDLERSLRVMFPTVKDVVSYHKPGSYSGSYYAFGWGLVYFAHNFEDEKCERPYLASYKGFLDSWRKNNEKTSAYDRFVDYFVTRPKRPGVATFEDLEKLWIAWILDLHRIYFGGPENADVLIARARRQAQAKKTDAAVESYRFALRKRPADLAALFELSELQAEKGTRDAAILSLRRALQFARQVEQETPVPNLTMTHGELAGACFDRITKLDKTVGDGVRSCVTGFAAAATAAADLYWKGGFPRRALSVLDDSIDLLRGDHGLAAQRDRIKQETGLDLARWRRIPITPELEGFGGSGGFKVDGDTLVGAFDPAKDLSSLKDAVQFLTRDEPLGTSYTVEALVDAGDSNFATGVVFGDSEKDGLKAVVIGQGRGVRTFVFDEETGPDFTSPKGRAPPGPVRLGAQVRIPPGAAKGTVAFLLDGQPIGSEEFDTLDFRPRVGVFAFLSNGRISGLRVRR